MGKLFGGKSELVLGIAMLILGVLLVAGVVPFEMILGIGLIAYGAIKTAANL